MGEMKRQPEREREQKTGVIITSALPAHRPEKQAERPTMPDHAQPAGRPGAGKARPIPLRYGPALSVTFPETGAPPHPFLPGFAQPALTLPDAVLNAIEFRLTPSGSVRCPPIPPTSP